MHSSLFKILFVLTWGVVFWVMGEDGESNENIKVLELWVGSFVSHCCGWMVAQIFWWCCARLKGCILDSLGCVACWVCVVPIAECVMGFRGL